MNKLILAIAFILILGGGYWYWSSHKVPVSSLPVDAVSSTPVPVGAGLAPSSTLPAVVVSITDEGFSPDTTTIKQGQTVKFVNAGKDYHWPASDLHPTHELYPEFDPKRPINPGDSWSFTFERVGRWPMHDHLHPNHRGAIVVEQ